MKRIIFLAIVSSLFLFQTSNGWAHVQGYEGFKTGHSKTPGPSQLKQIKKAQRQSPLRFEVNRGQTDPAVQFLARGPGYNLFLTPTESVLALSRPKTAPIPPSKTRHRPKDFLNEPPMQKPLAPQEFDTSVVRMRLSGANPSPQMQGEQKLPGVSNYIKGNDPQQWAQGIESYARVRYEDVYPGVDLVYYGKGSQLEYDFIVQPGTDPKAIKLSFDGVERYSIEGGDLILHTALGPLVQKAPVIYQDINGKRRTVDGNYAFLDGGMVSFYLRDYDTTQPLVIDPLLSWSTYLGGETHDSVVAVQVNSLRQLVVTGNAGANFPATDGSVLKGSLSAFVSVFSPDGSNLVFSTIIGGNSADGVRFLDIDSSDNIYISGWTSSDDFPLTGFNFQSINTGTSNYFIAKFNPSGMLQWSTYLGGSSFNSIENFSVSPSGTVLAVGRTQSDDFPTLNASQPVFGGAEDVFITQLTSNGLGIFSTYLGGSQDDLIPLIAFSSAGEVIVSVTTSSEDIPTHNALQPNYGGGRNDVLLAKFNATGNIVYSTYLGGSSWDRPWDLIIVDSSIDGASVAIVGRTNSPDFPIQDPLQTHGGSGDGFLSVIDGNGSLEFSTFLGGTDFEFANRIGLDSEGNIFVAGITRSSDFPATQSLDIPCTLDVGTCEGYFVTKINPFTQTILYSTLMFSEGRIFTGRFPEFKFKVDPIGNAHIFGTVWNEERIQTTPMAIRKTCFPRPGFPGECQDGYIIKLNPNGSPVFSTYLGGPIGSSGSSDFFGEVDPLGNIFVAGTTLSNDIPISPDALQPLPAGDRELFLTKIKPNGELAYSTYLGGTGKELLKTFFGDNSHFRNFLLGPHGTIYIAGTTESSDFPIFNALQPVVGGSAGIRDAFIMQWIEPQLALTDLQSEVDAQGLPGKFPKKLKKLLKKAGKLLSDSKSKNDLKGLILLFKFMQMVKAENGGKLVFEEADLLIDIARIVLEAQFHTLLIQAGGEGENPLPIFPIPSQSSLILGFIDDIEGLGLEEKTTKKLVGLFAKISKLWIDGKTNNDIKAVGLFFKFFKTVNKLTPVKISEVDAEFLITESSGLFHHIFHDVIPSLT